MVESLVLKCFRVFCGEMCCEVFIGILIGEFWDKCFNVFLEHSKNTWIGAFGAFFRTL